ncbi:MAG: ABC transporter ATP-binding protein [Maritimibacter sp.]
MIALNRLTLAIHDTPILKDITLKIAPGRVAGLVGESGSGKSMTALAIMGLLPHGAETSGQVLLDKQDLIDLPERRFCEIRGRRIGMIFQEPMTALNPVKPVGHQVMETLLIHGRATRTEAQEIARAGLARVGLAEDAYFERYPHELSGGQRQRVAIAMAIALGPELLIADEPTTALDVTTQAQILKLLHDLVREDNMSLLLITHDLAVVARMADHVAVMRQGEIVEQGPTEHLFRTMKHPYTRALLEATAHRPAKHFHSAQDVLLRAENVTRDYPGARIGLWRRGASLRAVDQVSFTLKRGETLGLVGESGCGKSTLTRALLGLEATQGGEIEVIGKPFGVGRKIDAKLRAKMQVVFQDPFASFDPRWTVERLVSEPLHLANDTPSDQRALVAQTLNDVGIETAAMDRYIHEFSGGQRQRIAIARALILRPDVIVLDEAVSALDVQVRAQILDLLAALQKAYGLAYLFISHDLSVVRGFADRVMVMRAGKIIEDGETEAVFTAPRHPYTRALIEAAPTIPEDWIKGQHHA